MVVAYFKALCHDLETCEDYRRGFPLESRADNRWKRDELNRLNNNQTYGPIYQGNRPTKIAGNRPCWLNR
jgi:hypothetical protein